MFLHETPAASFGRSLLGFLQVARVLIDHDQQRQFCINAKLFISVTSLPLPLLIDT